MQEQVPLVPAPVQANSTARGTAKAGGEAEAREASAAPAPAVVHRTALQRPASLVLEKSPDAQSDGSFSSTTFVPDYKFGRQDSCHSQGLDNTEEAKVEAALAQPSGQEDLSASTKSKTVLPLQAAQKPLASTLAFGLVGESSQAALETEAAAAAPTLDEKLSAASAKAEDTTRQVERAEATLAQNRKLSLERPDLFSRFPPGYLNLLETQLELLASRRDRELHELQELRAERQAGSTEQLNAG